MPSNSRRIWRLQSWEREWMMEFHPKKCQVLNITTKRNIIRRPYNIHGHTLEAVDSENHLGVHIHKNMRWNHRIDQVVKKANNTLAFLRRNLHHCPRNNKTQCYLKLVRSIVEYANTILVTHTKENINKMEMIQRRAAWKVNLDYQTTSSVT
jgi:hypothetical protein